MGAQNNHLNVTVLLSTLNVHFSSVVRLLDFHNRSSKIIGQEVSIDDRL